MLPLRDDNVLASLRSVSAVIIIERATGAILWRLEPEVLAQQHNATELASGNILVSDNGAFRGGESVTYMRAIEVDRATKAVVWEYRDRSQMVNFFTPFMGSAQRLANGNTLLTRAPLAGCSRSRGTGTSAGSTSTRTLRRTRTK